MRTHRSSAATARPNASTSSSSAPTEQTRRVAKGGARGGARSWHIRLFYDQRRPRIDHMRYGEVVFAHGEVSDDHVHMLIELLAFARRRTWRACEKRVRCKRALRL
eukprot:3271568-Pleurochrysis_carterae.AAC.1